MSTITDRALGVIPGYNNNALLKALEAQRHKGRVDNPGAAAAVHQRILDLAADNATIPVDVAAPIIENENNFRLWAARSAAIDNAIAALKSERAYSIQDGGDSALAVLHDELTTLTATVRELAPDLSGVTNADHAIQSGPASVAAWSRVLELVADYDEIRNVQKIILRDQDKSEGLHARPMMHYGLLADSIEQLPYWGELRSLAGGRSKAQTTDADAFIGWLTAGHSIMNAFDWDQRNQLNSQWWPDNDPAAKVAHLVWIATHCNPWVPSMRTLRAAMILAHEVTATVIHASGAGGPQPRLRSLSALTELTSTDWPAALPAPISDDQERAARLGNGSSGRPWDAAAYLAQRLTEIQ